VVVVVVVVSDALRRGDRPRIPSPHLKLETWSSCLSYCASELVSCVDIVEAVGLGTPGGWTCASMSAAIDLFLWMQSAEKETIGVALVGVAVGKDKMVPGPAGVVGTRRTVAEACNNN